MRIPNPIIIIVTKNVRVNYNIIKIMNKLGYIDRFSFKLFWLIILINSYIVIYIEIRFYELVDAIQSVKK